MYTFRYRESGTADWTVRDNLTSLGITASGLQANTIYEAQVRSTVGGQTSAWSSSWNARTSRINPPSNFRVTGTTTTSVSLEWDAPDLPTGVTVNQYHVRWRTGTDTFGTSGRIITNLTSLGVTVPSLIPNTRYDFQLIAYTSAGTGGWSSSIVGTTSAVQAPSNLRVTTKTHNSISYQWDAVTDALRYEFLYKKTTAHQTHPCLLYTSPSPRDS